MYKLLGPVIGMFLFISNRIIIIFGGEKIKEVPLITEEDVRALIEMSEKEGLLKEEEREMIHSIFDFGETIVKEIMTPRVDLAVLPINTTLEEARKKTVLCGHSRIPVYEKEIDQVIGILYAKDLLRLENGNQVSLREIIRPALFVPETTPLNILLQQFRKEKNHIAIVVDEYGVTVGIITIEDVLEEIVGDIQDEYDKEPPMYEINQDGTITANAKIYLDDLEEILQYVFPEKEVETLGGFVSTLMGTVPSKGEILIHDHLTFKILDADKRKIKRILIKENPPADQEDKDKLSE
jgi:putative hemolysin